ncbi:MAG: thermonuclease family protein [Clostridia bacterium]|nr:thermonuclease family protein [Clostridia bacterium]
MNKLSKILILLLVIVMLVGTFAACGPTPDTGSDSGSGDTNTNTNTNTDSSGGEEEPEFVDYASQLKFNPDSGKKWAYVTVKSYIDGDTTHFYIDKSEISEGFVKARYLGINTPESTGIVEPWGKKASNYTKTQLKKAESIENGIIVESDTATWDLDSTGERHLLWIWYKTEANGEYRNLNIEILQQGLAFGSGTTSNTYSEYTTAALYQATSMNLFVFKKKVKDPDFYYGKAQNLTLKELKANAEKYEGTLVKFDAVVAKKSGYTFYVEEYDAENDMYFGMQIFAGAGCPIMDRFAIGNRVTIVGTLQYWENGGTYQVSNLQYDILFPDDEGGCRVLETGNEASYREGDANTLLNGKIEIDSYIEVEDENGEIVEKLETVEFDYGALALHSTIKLSNLTVQSVYTTNTDTASKGALTITCKDQNGVTIEIRTASKLVREDGETVVVASDFPRGTVIDVKGIVDYFDDYQVKVFNIDDITVHQ